MKSGWYFVFFVVALSGCATTQMATQGVNNLSGGARVAVIRPDIKYYRVTAGGVPELAPDWTESARREFDLAFADYVAEAKLQVSSPAADSISDELHEFSGLHSAVGTTIQNHHFGPIKLPSKRVGRSRDYNFDWSLGAGMSDLGLDADYALFIYYRDYQASGGRVGMVILAAAFNISLYAGHQGGFASLVDLRDGTVVWYNNVPSSSGDLRTDQGAQRIVRQLFEGLDQQGS